MIHSLSIGIVEVKRKRGKHYAGKTGKMGLI